MRRGRYSWLLVLLVGLAGCRDASDDGSDRRASSPPETFFAVLGFEPKIVEVATATGDLVRTVAYLADSGPADDPVYIDSLDVDSDRRTLYFGVGPTGPLYRVRLPDGSPERIGSGNGITVSPNGQRLAFARGRDLVVRDPSSGREHVFEGLIGDLGGRPVSWARDSNTLAVEIDGADVTSVVLVDADTGDATELTPRDGDPRNYTPHQPWFQPSEGLVAVVCCTSGEVDPNAPPSTPDLVLHDPTTGKERDRNPLRVPGRGFDYDTSSTHQLLTSDDGVYRRSGSDVTRIPNIGGARVAVW